MWGAVSDAPKGTVQELGASVLVNGDDGGVYCFTPMVLASIQRVAGGDSGALVAWNGESTRHVTGLMVAGNSSDSTISYIRADDLMTAFRNAGVEFDHYWGTNSTTLRPSTTQYDNPC